MKDTDKIIRKEKIIDECIKTLKAEFIGIDSVIDQVMNNIKTWYIFPEMNERPLVINLWGMTGCGKTSLVNRICDLLELRENLVYYNLAKLGEDNSDEMENTFNRSLGYSNKSSVFVFDEFQFAASIDSTGKEKESKTSLKTIWEIIDTGKIYREMSDYTKRHMKRIIYAINIMDSFGAVIEHGKWVNSEKCIENMSVEQKSEILSLFNVTHEVNEIYRELVPTRYWCEITDTSVPNNKEFYMSSEITGLLYDATYSLGDHDYTYEMYVMKCLSNMNLTDLHDYTMKTIKRVAGGYVSDYSKSLVFVMGNIDEAYKISYDVNPDMDPDQFRLITEKLTVVDIREALQERFRNEQIARLGSIQILYPSFSKKNFENIIEQQLEKYAETVKHEMNINMHFDDSLKQMIYSDGVFPTQGTRPVFAAVYEIAQTKLAHIVTECLNMKIYDISDIYMSAKGDKVITKALHGNEVVYEKEFVQNLRIESLRTNVKKEQQVLTAVHESGHFVVYAKLTGKKPAKLMSVTASSDANGFMLTDTDEDNNYMTCQDYLNDICVSLAGYAAELMVFGEENVTSGAEQDLRHATVTASKMLRNFGMLFGCPVTTYLTDLNFTEGGNLLKDSDTELESANSKIRKTIAICLDETKKILSDGIWNDMFKKSCEYMSEHAVMPKDKMDELYEAAGVKEHEGCFKNGLDKYLGK